jgi:hypothetical protein
METAKQRGQDWLVTLLGSFSVGAGAIVFVYGVMKWLTVQQSPESPEYVHISPLVVFPVIVVPFFLVGCFVSFRRKIHRQLGIASPVFAGVVVAYGGIAVGVIMWALMVEELVFRRLGHYPIYEEHNLFPFEIIIWWVYAAIPMVIGILLGPRLGKILGHGE